MKKAVTCANLSYPSRYFPVVLPSLSNLVQSLQRVHNVDTAIIRYHLQTNSLQLAICIANQWVCDQRLWYRSVLITCNGHVTIRGPVRLFVISDSIDGVRFALIGMSALVSTNQALLMSVGRTRTWYICCNHTPSNSLPAHTVSGPAPVRKAPNSIPVTGQFIRFWSSLRVRNEVANKRQAAAPCQSVRSSV